MEPQILRGVKINDLVFVMGDPGRVMLLSKILNDWREEFNSRGYIVVNGEYRGYQVTLASHGIGCPMSAILFEELRMLGAKTIIRLGTAGALLEELMEGDIVLADPAGSFHGMCSTGMYFGDITPPASPDPFLLVKTYDLLRERGVKPYILPVFSSDTFYAEDKYIKAIREAGYRAVDMETVILYSLGRLRGYRALSILIVSNNLVRKTPLKHTLELREYFIKLFKILLENIEALKTIEPM